MLENVFIYLCGSFFAFVLVLGYYYEEYYSIYDEPDLETITEEHPESKYWLTVAAIFSWIYIAVFALVNVYMWLKEKFKK